MRIIGGVHKGRRYNAPKSIPARPTTDYAKEGIFNILENRLDFENISALDLFAGIGGLSFEMASRGAQKVVSIDRNFHSIKWIKEQSSSLNLPIESVKYDALKWLEKTGSKFPLVMADPPYDFLQYDLLIALVLKNALEPKGIFVLEHSQSNTFVQHENFIEHRKYGEVEFSLFSD